jgi:uncharacterized beta-barrel protein YwiB (DUF1934 family)
MHKDVIVSVSGTQFAMNPNEPIEIISIGERYEADGKTYVLYEEVVEDGTDNAEVTKNTIKLGEGRVELIKKGMNNTHMIFEKGKNHMASYNTPLGNLMISIYTKEIFINKKEDAVGVQINYSLDINYSHVSDCKLIIRVVSKSN